MPHIKIGIDVVIGIDSTAMQAVMNSYAIAACIDIDMRSDIDIDTETDIHAAYQDRYGHRHRYRYYVLVLGVRKREVSNVSQSFHRFFHCRTFHDIS